MKKAKKQEDNIKQLILTIIILGMIVIATAVGINVTHRTSLTEEGVTSEIIFADETQPAMIEDGDMGEVVETTEVNGTEIKTVEEVDGGLFEDVNTGTSAIEGEYEDLGAYVETFDTSSPEAFKNDTLGKCVYASNKYGAQCVSLSRSFWVSYAHRDVSTCGTGMAKGMMNCAEQNAGNDFLVYWSDSANKIQAGDWLVFNGGQYGHIGMALGPVTNGYVALLGENQGGAYCQGGGAATNIININIKNLIGFYRPKAYIKPEPKPQPKPTPAPAPVPAPSPCKVRTVKKGETLGKIMKECKGKTTWGKAMNDYAKQWVSKKTGKTVFYGWTHGSGYGLFANDTITYTGK